jgi:uncharacterized protein YodC (DUF2158 family)
LLLLDHHLSFLSLYFVWYQELSCEDLDLQVVIVRFFIISIAKISIVVRQWTRKDDGPKMVVVANKRDGEKRRRWWARCNTPNLIFYYIWLIDVI